MGTRYKPYGLTLTESQKRSVANAVKNKTEVTVRLSADQLVGKDELLLTDTQINKIQKHKNLERGLDLKLSKTQLKKYGGILPLLLAALGALGGLAGGAAGITKAIHDKHAADAAHVEQVRHHKAMEKKKAKGLYLATKKN